MLINKGEVTFFAKYNGVEKEIAPGGNLDVRDFDISSGQTAPLNKLVPLAEKFFLKKYPGQFEQTNTVDDIKSPGENNQKIKELTAEIESLRRENKSLKEAGEVNSRKISEMSEQVNGFGDKDALHKSEVKKLQKTIKEMEEDHEAHIARIMGKPESKKK